MKAKPKKKKDKIKKVITPNIGKIKTDEFNVKVKIENKIKK